MQFLYLDVILIGVPPIFVGLGVGYILGGVQSFAVRDRILLALAFGVIGGIVSSILLTSIGEQIGIVITQAGYAGLLGVLSMMAGCFLGMSFSWVQPRKASTKKSRIIFDPDEDDEEFDREIEQAFRSKEN